MKFKDILDRVAEPVSGYRKAIFKTIITGLLINKSARTIAGIFRGFACLFMGTATTRKRFYLFLGSAKVNWNRIWEIAIDLIGDRILTHGRLLLLLDDTTYGKSGKHINGCAVHFDHAAKLNVAKWIFGHCRVLVGVLLFTHGRWACLPLAQKLFKPTPKPKDSAKKAGKGKRKTKKAKRNKNRKSKPKKQQETKLTIAITLVNAIRKLVPAPVLVICDSWFGNKTMVKGLEADRQLGVVHILSRLRVTCALFAKPGPRPKHKHGAPKKYGKRLPPLPELVGQLEKKTGNFFIYGKLRECSYSEFTCMARFVQREIGVVIIHRRNGTFFPLFSTDLTLTAQQMIEYYAARWKIESGFKELKHDVGALDNQARKEHSVENHFNLCCLAMTLAWIHATNQKKAPPRQHPKPSSPSYSFGDVREQIRKEFQQPLTFSGFCPKVVKTAAKRILEHLFSSAA